jgi:hypothetical protein
MGEFYKYKRELSKLYRYIRELIRELIRGGELRGLNRWG